MKPFDGTLPELLILLNASGVAEYADGSLTLRLGGTGAKSFEQLVKPSRHSKPEPDAFDDIAVALGQVQPQELD